ncbi:MAG: hypothetical protein HGB35_00090 [Geobacteraceae bacterium]|nr:hypothetical protein [Geobacteraceae bacterium]
MTIMDTEYDILQDRITELLHSHTQRNAALSAIYQRAIEQDVMSMIDAGIVSADDIDQAVSDLEGKLGTVTDNVAYQVLNRAQDLIKVQQYFWDRYGYTLDLSKEYGRLQAIQANTFDAFDGIPKNTGEAIRTLLRDNEVMGKGKSFVNDEIRRLAGVTASRAQLISGTSEFLYVGQFNANKAEDLGVKKFRYKPGFVIPTSRPFSRWAVSKSTFTSDELAAIDRKDWAAVPGIPLYKTGDGWQGMIPGVPVLVQGGGYNTIHRFAMVFLDGPVPKVTRPLPASGPSGVKVSLDGASAIDSRSRKASVVLSRQSVSTDLRAERIKMSEDTIRGNGYETLLVFDQDGNELRKVRGTKSQVKIPVEVADILTGKVVSHNHPGGNSFSPQDIVAGKRFVVSEMRVVTSSADHSVEYTERGLSVGMQRFITEMNVSESATRRTLGLLVQSGEITPEEYSVRFWHEVWDHFSNTGFINYKRSLI